MVHVSEVVGISHREYEYWVLLTKLRPIVQWRGPSSLSLLSCHVVKRNSCDVFSVHFKIEYVITVWNRCTVKIPTLYIIIRTKDDLSPKIMFTSLVDNSQLTDRDRVHDTYTTSTPLLLVQFEKNQRGR